MAEPPIRKKRTASLKDVAAALGVSPATISNAYNRPHHLSAELREKVFQMAQQLGYPGPNPIARSLRYGQAGALGVLYSQSLSYAFMDPVSSQFLQGLAAATEETGLGLLLIPPTGTQAGLSTVQGANVDGLILYSMAEGDPRIEAALARQLPTVVIDQPRLPRLPFIGIDDQDAAAKAARHLLDLGHRRIGMVSMEFRPGAESGLMPCVPAEPSHYAVTRHRLQGYLDVLEAHGLQVGLELKVYHCQMNSIEEGRQATHTLLDHDPEITALLTMSDQLAFGALQAARERRLNVPRDLSLVGFDDAPGAEQAGLTTIHQPTEQKGRQTGQALLDLLQNRELRDVQLLDIHLKVRQTTAKPAAG